VKKLPAQVEAQGLLAYEQARAFEALRRAHWPLIYAALTLLLAAVGVATLRVDTVALPIACLVGAVLFPFIAWFHWRRLRARHETHLRFLTELELKYGAEMLPWVQVERHFAALAKLEADLAEEKQKNESGP
jgi:hypothetical protein